ncbi:MAG: type II toxin-antitoxin system VapC family toxin [Gemmatimonadaceae bacterium]|nr:type II toxin-antitoxin system VapC family toxin [Gemmatimonadaceae bacterium]
MLLLDTHALLWWLTGDSQLSARARAHITASARVYVSSASIWEIAIKTRLGKLPDGELLLAELPDALDAQGFDELPIVGRDAQLAGLFPLHHRDPFDRMLAAQSLRLGAPLVTNDGVFARYGVITVW